MNIWIYLWPQNQMNICRMNIFVFIYWNIFYDLQRKNSKKSKTECLNIFVALKSNQYFDEWIYLSINIWIYLNMQIFAKHWYLWYHATVVICECVLTLFGPWPKNSEVQENSWLEGSIGPE